MKKNIYIISILVLFILSILFYFYDWAVQMGGGGGRPLGETAKIELSCSQPYAKQQLDELLMNKLFKVTESDSTIVKYWKNNGYDFLDYVCINIDETLYMVSLRSENFKESELSIRAYYNRKKAKWIFAGEFSGTDKKEAKKAQEYLITHLKSC